MNNEHNTGSRAAQLASLAVKTAKIAAAASASGPYGAAIETVKQFLPQFIKITAIALIITLLLPVLIFTGIPHFLFGWADNDNTEIKDFTAKALAARSAYELYDTTLNSTIEQSIESIDMKGYNDYEITINMNGTSFEWVVAVISVKYQQDLNTITPQIIADFIKDLLVMTLAADNLILNIIFTAPGRS